MAPPAAVRKKGRQKQTLFPFFFPTAAVRGYLRLFFERKILLGIGNRYDNNLQFLVERIGHYGSYALAEYVSVVLTWQLTSTAAAGIVWLIVLVGVPSGYRTARFWQTGRRREQTGP